MLPPVRLYDPLRKVVVILDRQAARDVRGRRLAIADPLDGEFGLMLRCHMRRGREVYAGPAVYFDPAAFAEPVLPRGGRSAAQATAAYLRAAPVPITVPTGRLQVQLYQRRPAPTWRRVPQCGARVGAGAPRALRGRAMRDAGAAVLRRWYLDVRAAWWQRYAVHRFVADAAAGEIVAYDRDGRRVPSTYWQSGVELELERREGVLRARSPGAAMPGDAVAPRRRRARTCARPHPYRGRR